jgi:hypothetical protein
MCSTVYKHSREGTLGKLAEYIFAHKGRMLALLLLFVSALFSVTQPPLQASIISISNSTTSHNISVTLTDDITANDTVSSRQFLALDEFSSRVLGFCITAAIGVFFGTYTILTRSKKPIRTTLSVATLAGALGVLAMLIIVGPASQVVIPFLRSLASGSPEQAAFLVAAFGVCLVAMILVLKRSARIESSLVRSTPHETSQQTQGRLKLSIKLPVERWGEKPAITVEIESTKLVVDLVNAGLKEVGVIAHGGPWYLVAGKKILGPESYDKPIQTSGIQNNQTIFLTDKPRIEVPGPRVLKQPYVPQYAEPKVLTLAELVSLARDWVRGQLPNLELREWTDNVNEGDTVVQVRGVVKDQYVLTHEFDVRVSREDGSIQEGSYVK